MMKLFKQEIEKFSHLREQLQQVTSEMNQRDQTIRQTCEPSIDLGNEMQRISISNRQECAHPPEIRLKVENGQASPRRNVRMV